MYAAWRTGIAPASIGLHIHCDGERPAQIVNGVMRHFNISRCALAHDHRCRAAALNAGEVKTQYSYVAPSNMPNVSAGAVAINLCAAMDIGLPGDGSGTASAGGGGYACRAGETVGAWHYVDGLAAVNDFIDVSNRRAGGTRRAGVAVAPIRGNIKVGRRAGSWVNAQLRIPRQRGIGVALRAYRDA